MPNGKLYENTLMKSNEMKEYEFNESYCYKLLFILEIIRPCKKLYALKYNILIGTL